MLRDGALADGGYGEVAGTKGLEHPLQLVRADDHFSLNECTLIARRRGCAKIDAEPRAVTCSPAPRAALNTRSTSSSSTMISPFTMPSWCIDGEKVAHDLGACAGDSRCRPT